MASDVGDRTPDVSEAFGTCDEAARELVRMFRADPPYDKGWLERRLISEWERTDG